MTEKFIRDALMLWATIDPIGTLALFATITGSLSDSERRHTAIRATLYSAMILIGSVVVGQFLLAGMGIDLVSFQVAGGIILFLFGLQMVFSSNVRTPTDKPEAQHDLAVFPLAVPSIASPGAIMAAIVLTDNNLYSIPVQVGTAGILLGILLVTCLLMLAARHILKIIGKNGSALLIRIMGMILSALSVQLVFDALGIEQWLKHAP